MPARPSVSDAELDATAARFGLTRESAALIAIYGVADETAALMERFGLSPGSAALVARQGVAEEVAALMERFGWSGEVAASNAIMVKLGMWPPLSETPEKVKPLPLHPVDQYAARRRAGGDTPTSDASPAS
jgi:hypothetical protein